MRAETAAAYCDEVSTDAFLRAVGRLYPEPCNVPGKGKRWYKEQLDEALEMWLPEIAFAARAAWDLLVRVEEIWRDMVWSDVRPADKPDHVFLRYHKNSASVWKPMQDTDPDGTIVPFYVELEAYLAMIPKRGISILTHPGRVRNITDKTVWKRYTQRLLTKRAAEVREAADLPAHVTLTSFRHGGLTELGDGELPDTLAQALSRHKQRGTLDRYIHRTDTQMKQASRIRLAHRRQET